jgi:hypothetical protein
MRNKQIANLLNLIRIFFVAHGLQIADTESWSGKRASTQRGGKISG